MGQLAFFAEFLEVSAVFERWVQQCPLHYSSGNVPTVRDVLGTWMLRTGYPMDTGLRPCHQDTLWTPKRSRSQLQPAQARAIEPHGAYVLDKQPAAGIARAGAKWQPR